MKWFKKNKKAVLEFLIPLLSFAASSGALIVQFYRGGAPAESTPPPRDRVSVSIDRTSKTHFYYSKQLPVRGVVQQADRLLNVQESIAAYYPSYPENIRMQHIVRDFESETQAVTQRYMLYSEHE